MAESTYQHRLLAGIYDQLHQQLAFTAVGPHGEPPQDVQFYLAQLRRLGSSPPRSVLELGAGTGRVTIPLAEAGHRVTGLEAAEQMLQVAGTKRARLSVEVQERLRFVHGDWHNYDLGRGRFDIVLCPFSAFQRNITIEEQDRFLQLAHQHLEPGGILVLDVFFPDFSLLAVPQQPRQPRRMAQWQSKQWREHEQVVRSTSAQSFVVTFDYEPVGDRGERVEQSVALTWFLPRELHRMLLANHFCRVEILDGYRGGAVRDDSQRQVVLARPEA